MIRLILGSLAALVAHAAIAATAPVAPGEDVAAIKAAACGDTLAFAGAFDHVFLKGRICPADNRLTFAFSGATLANFRVLNSEGIAITGGAAFAPSDYLGAVFVGSSKHVSVTGIGAKGDGTWSGVIIRDSFDVSVIGSSLDGLHTAVSLLNVDGFTVTGNSFFRTTADGFEGFSVHNGLVAFNSCAGSFSIGNGAHRDCAQLANTIPYAPATSNVEVKFNVSAGDSQGFTAFTKSSLVGGDPGFVNVRITDNVVAGTQPQGVALYSGDAASRVERNHVWTQPGSPWQVKVNIVGGAPGHCGNRAEPYGAHAASIDGGC